MNQIINDYGQFLFIAIGIACVVKGVITITTGKMPEREMMRLNDFSENGLRKYKILSSVMNIVGGLLCVAVSVIKMFNLVDSFIFKIVVIAILVVMFVVYVIIRNSCKKAE